MTIHQAISLAQNLLNDYTELKHWSVSTNKRKRAFGVCNYTHQKIELSEFLIPHMTDEAIKDTIIHEIAHALTRGHNHDYVWRRKCIELGGNGHRVGGDEKYKNASESRQIIEKSAKYTLTCPVCGDSHGQHRKSKRSSSCGKCSRYYNEKYKFIVTQNY